MVDVSALEKRIFSVYQDDKTFINFMSDLIGEGATPYLSGGFVRDSILGIKPKDYDVIIDKDVDNQTLADYGEKYGSVIIKPYFGIRLNYDGQEVDVWKFADYEFRGSSIQSIEEAILDFDLNINALAYNVKDNQLVDPLGIAPTLKQTTISILDACHKQPLSENKIVVVLRAIKLAYKTGLTLGEDAQKFIEEHAQYLPQLKWQVRDALGAYLNNEHFLEVLKQRLGEERAVQVIKMGKEQSLGKY